MLPYSNTFGGCQRMYFLAENLVENGVDVTVLSSKKVRHGFFGKKINFDSLYFGNEASPPIFCEEQYSAKVLIKNKLRTLTDKIASYYFNEPSNLLAIRAFFWLAKYKKQILLSIEEKNIDTVIVSGPPFTLFSIVKDIKKKYPKVKVILDYRDPWGLWNYKKSIAYFREQSYLKKADQVVVVTPMAMEDTYIHFKLKQKPEVVYNGYSDLVWKGIDQKTPVINTKINISFIGSIDFLENSYRNTKPFFAAYEKYQDDIELRFVGAEKTKETEFLISKYKGVEILPKVTQEESLEYMMSSDVLLTMHTASDGSGKYLIQGKVFDYLKSGKLLFSIGAKNDFTNVFIDKNKVGLTCDNNIKDIENVFEQLIKLKDEGEFISSNEVNDFNVSDYSRENQNNAYVKLINKGRKINASG